MLSISYLVYSVNYLVCLLITRTNQVGEYSMLVWDLWFIITTFVLGLCPRVVIDLIPRNYAYTYI